MNVNFACDFPCATCSSSSKKKCTSCYSTNDYKYLYSSYCYANCPSGTYESLEANICLPCSSNCKTCDSTATYCTSCNTFFYLTGDNTCESSNSYPFPFLIASFLMTLTVCFFILFKRETKFREGTIALVSWVEIACWITCAALFGGVPQILMILAVVFYFLFNNVFGVIHEKHIFPRSDAYYQEVVVTEHKKHARLVIIASFVVTFKFQHILLSNILQKERYSGDFNMDCWRIWNKFALVYLLTFYPLVMAAGILSIIEPASAIAGYLGLELTIITTFIAFLLLVCIMQFIGTIGPFAKLACCKRCRPNEHE